MKRERKMKKNKTSCSTYVLFFVVVVFLLVFILSIFAAFISHSFAVILFFRPVKQRNTNARNKCNNIAAPHFAKNNNKQQQNYAPEH